MSIKFNVEMKKSIRKNKGFTFLTIIISVNIFGDFVYSTYTSDFDDNNINEFKLQSEK